MKINNQINKSIIIDILTLRVGFLSLLKKLEYNKLIESYEVIQIKDSMLKEKEELKKQLKWALFKKS